MNKEQAKRKEQPEFLFVLNSQPEKLEAQPISHTPAGTIHSSDFIKEEEVKSLRQTLISELKEFGC